MDDSVCIVIKQHQQQAIRLSHSNIKSSISEMKMGDQPPTKKTSRTMKASAEGSPENVELGHHKQQWQEDTDREPSDHLSHHTEGDLSDEQAGALSLCLQIGLVIVVHVIFIAFSVIQHFIYAWSDDSDATAWLARTDESVIQHMKMILWPWLVVLFPFDALNKSAIRNGRTWYLRKLKSTSWLTLCQSHLLALSFAMLFIAGVYRLYTALADVTDNLPADIVIFCVAVSVAPVLRIYLLGRDQAVGWMISGLFLLVILCLFTYLSYEDNLHEAFWLDPHEGEDHW